MSKPLPSRPNLEQLKNQAKDLLKAFKSADPDALKRFQEHSPRRSARSPSEIGSATLTLTDAQRVIARENGFSNWTKLKERVTSLTPAADPLQILKAAVVANDPVEVARALEQYPELKLRLDDPLPDYGFGETALMAAVQRTNREIIELLLQAGANINARSHWWAGGFGVLDDDRGLAPFLIERGATVEVHAAARLNMADKLKELVTANPGLVHARGGDGQTPLHFARTVEVSDYLLDNGADINALDVDHESTPAQYMVRDRQGVARNLVKRGCRTDLLMAAALGDLDLVRRHLDADPACIRMSVSKEYFPMKNPRAGGTIYIWTLGQHKTPHTVAREFGHEEVFRLLLDRSPDELKLSQACELGDEAIFNALLARHPNLVQALSEPDRRKLAYAAQNNNTEAVRLMLAAGWPVDVRGQHGGTPLHWAAFHGNAVMARTILRYQPPLECVDADFNSRPLGWAIHGSENGWHRRTGDYAATVEALLQAGAKPPEKLEGTEAVKEVIQRFGVSN